MSTPMNGNRLLYVLFAAMLTITLASAGAVYGTLSRRVEDVAAEQGRWSSRTASLETRADYNDRDLRDIKTQLTRIEAEVIALRILIAQKVR